MTPAKYNLTAKEKEAVNLLAEAWRLFGELPALHPNAQAEFCHSIHTAQNIILARPALRQLAHEGTPKETPDND